ncbi:hypothetical protein AB0M43_09315 [Longispora sp. NPDC051575]|uniref:hypothetical protein n=1 Tax=Longispora sp. NPDC051575 TaxID=3154943 RepID=UPI003421DBEF
MPTVLERARTAAAHSPSRLRSLGALTVAGLLLLGLVGGVTIDNRATAARDLATRSEPLSLDAQELYRSLADADATAASGFLSGGVEPAELRKRYDADIARAMASLSHATEVGGADAAGFAEVARNIPVYTGLVETARTNNRQGQPVGAAYLREASGLMQNSMLPAVNRGYRAQNARAAADADAASAFPWWLVLVTLLVGAGLFVGQRDLARRTRRILNHGLVAATLAAALALGWAVVGLGAESVHLSTARSDGLDQVNVLSEIRLLALQARADESLTLVARGTGKSFEERFQQTTAKLSGSGGLFAKAKRTAPDDAARGLVTRAEESHQAWLRAHVKVRELDDSGDYPGAVRVAIGSDPTSAAAAFTQLDTGLDTAIKESQTTFARYAAKARGAVGGAGIGFGLLCALGAAAAAWGVGQRLKEYR